MYGEFITITCKTCQKPFERSRAIAEKRHLKFCSPACANAHRSALAKAKRPVWTCEQCGKNFQRKYERKYPARFCSWTCSDLAKNAVARRATRPLVHNTCRICQQPFTTRVPTKLYCSHACQYKRHELSTGTTQACEHCGEAFSPRHDRTRFCSRQCLYASMTGEKSASWKGGKRLTPEGYVRVYMKHHPQADQMGYVLEHRFVMEQKIGRLLDPDETVHHLNCNRADNRPENLELWVSRHVKGARVVDLVAWAKAIVAQYEPLLDRL